MRRLGPLPARGGEEGLCRSAGRRESGAEERDGADRLRPREPGIGSPVAPGGVKHPRRCPPLPPRLHDALSLQGRGIDGFIQVAATPPRARRPARARRGGLRADRHGGRAHHGGGGFRPQVRARRDRRRVRSRASGRCRRGGVRLLGQVRHADPPGRALRSLFLRRHRLPARARGRGPRPRHAPGPTRSAASCCGARSATRAPWN